MSTANSGSDSDNKASTDRPTVYVGFAGDLVHHGHVNIVRVAAKLGRVVIGLLTDEAIATYKRQTIVKWENRKRVVQAFLGVDEVIAQTTLDYSGNLIKLKPRYVVHGSDWRNGTQQRTRDRVIELLATWGGELIEPEYTPNISTTDIIARCQEYERLRREGKLPQQLLQPPDKEVQLPSELVSTAIVSTVSNRNQANLDKLRPIAYVCVSSDFIHHGIVQVIEEAAKRGRVIVGVLTDDAIQSYKGAKPVVSFEHRVQIFNYLRNVRAVIPQATLNYTANLRALKPEFVVHGDNWRTDIQQPIRALVLDALAKWGGQLIESTFAADATPKDDGDAKEQKAVRSIDEQIVQECYQRLQSKPAASASASASASAANAATASSGSNASASTSAGAEPASRSAPEAAVVSTSDAAAVPPTSA